ncbi:transport and Golgi organization protein 1 homolog isoform X2 [Prionailurus viverrinus]|uniref:transport and Golgi organization protein 1 homolog isoform X2 n=1 Tax=Prionailurus viverrinus TaxID=61388 RepID=UPI001FF504C2|nr:transport and Golgi organization protein 1 homolog isoform X2 [Prionailurus viverrinus]
MWGYPLHVTWDLTAPKSLRCLRNEGRVCFFNLCTISSNQNKPPSLLGPFADPEVAPVSENNTDSTKRAKKDKAIMYARGPGPFPGWPCRHYHMDHPSSPAKGCGPPPPPPPAPPPTPFGQLEV